MIEGKTKSGFKFRIDEDVFDNYELLDCMTSLSKGDDTQFVSVVKMLLGEDQEKALREHLRDKRGIVKTTVMTEEVVEIMNLCKDEGKNSSPSPT